MTLIIREYFVDPPTTLIGFCYFMQAVAKFMSKVRGGRVRFDPDRILMSGGATGANELIMFCLADPGDAFLVPSPYYPAYVSSLSSSKFSFNVCHYFMHKKR